MTHWANVTLTDGKHDIEAGTPEARRLLIEYRDTKSIWHHWACDTDELLGKCEECHGEGKIECAECDDDSAAECAECNGDREIECAECDGHGHYRDDGDSSDAGLAVDEIDFAGIDAAEVAQ